MAKRLRPLSGLDAGFLYLEEAGTPMHVGSVMLVELPTTRGYDFRQRLIAHLGERLPRAPALRRVLQPAPLTLGHPMWAQADQVDLEDHVRARKLAGRGGEAALMRLVARLHAEPLARDRPLWQFVVIDNVGPSVVALYSKVHHALIDGQGGIALAQALLDIEVKPAPRRVSAAAKAAAQAEADAAPRLRRRDATRVAVGATVSQFAKLLRAVPATLKFAGGAVLAGSLKDSVLLAPRSVFNRQLGAGRSFAALSLPLSELKRVARGFGVSLNDVVLALCAGALRDLLKASGDLPRKPLVAAMPVSLRAAGDGESNNQVSMVQCSLATDVADPVARLQAIRASTALIKQRVSAFKDLIPTDFPGLAAPLWAAGLSRLWARGRIAERLPALANVAISNVPGPPVPLYLAGARLRHYYPVSIVTHGLGLNITVQSYVDSLEFGITAASDIVAKPEVLARAIATELATLAARLPHD